MIRSGMTLQLKLRRLFLLGIDADQVIVYNLNRKHGCCAQMMLLKKQTFRHEAFIGITEGDDWYAKRSRTEASPMLLHRTPPGEAE